MGIQQTLIPKWRFHGDLSQWSSLHYRKWWTSLIIRIKKLPYKRCPHTHKGQMNHIHTTYYQLKDTQTAFQDYISDIITYCKNQDTPIKGACLAGGTYKHITKQWLLTQETFPFSVLEQDNGICCINLQSRGWIHSKILNSRITLQNCYFAVTARKDRLKEIKMFPFSCMVSR